MMHLITIFGGIIIFLECTDIVSSAYDCEFLKGHGACKTSKDRMKEMCPGTCGYCRQ